MQTILGFLFVCLVWFLVFCVPIGKEGLSSLFQIGKHYIEVILFMKIMSCL